ncbi:MAG: outer membrane lipoprotein-sorting protein [Candidatus Margulisiibacteriota bacterium]
MRKLIGLLVSFALCLALVAPSLAGDLSVKDLVSKIQSNQSRINDMYAETVTTITSSMVMPGSKGQGPQTMTQKGKIWNKGKDKSKVEMLSPMKQITITNGDKMAIINPETGQKMVQDMKKMRQAKGQAEPQKEMNFEKALDYFNLTMEKKGNDYVITGTPKEANKFFGRMEFVVDSGKMIPTSIMMYDPKGRLVSQSVIEYQKIADIWIPVKNLSNVTTPAGKMKVEMQFQNIKVNKGIGDDQFKVE